MTQPTHNTKFSTTKAEDQANVDSHAAIVCGIHLEHLTDMHEGRIDLNVPAAA